MSVTINGSSGLVFADSTAQTTAATCGLVNKIINSDMMIDQRNAGAQMSGSIAGSYTLDRWVYDATQNSKVTIQQNAGSVTPPVGFSNYLGVTSVSAYTVGSGDLFNIAQYIEGFNTSDLAWGTANAQTVTLSFRVYSSLTGTFGGALQNNARTQSYPFTYTISAANTWETKTVTIAGSTTGTWVGATNGRGLSVFLGLGVGSTYSATAGSWQSGDYRGATGATSVVGTNGATFYITGVDLRKGTVGATAQTRDVRPYGTELALCQRYFQPAGQGSAGRMFSNTTAELTSTFQVPMRAAPTVTLGGFAGSQSLVSVFGTGDFTATALAGTGRTTGAYIVPNGWTGSSAGQFCAISAGNLFSANAEL